MTLTFYSDTHSQLSAEGLDENSIKVLQYVLQNGSIANTEIQSLLKISKTTAPRTLWQLEKWLEKIRNHRKRYILYTKNKGFIKGSHNEGRPSGQPSG